MSEYTVQLYEDENGKSQILNFLENAKRRNPRVYAAALHLMEQYLPSVAPDGLRFPKSKHISGPIYELRKDADGGALRIYYWRDSEHVYIAAAAELKRGRDDADQALVDYALAAHKEWNSEG